MMPKLPEISTRRILLRICLAVALGLALIVGFVCLNPHELRHDVVELAKAALWPAAAVLGLLVLGESLVELLQTLGGRVSKFSIFKIDFELQKADSRALKPQSLANLRDPLAVAAAGDSSGAVVSALTETSACDYVVIDLGTGDKWLTTRIFILAALLGRLRALRCIVFVETVNGEPRRIVGTASPDRVRWLFAMRWPWLEQAFVHAEDSVRYSHPYGFHTEGPPSIISAGGSVSGHVAQEIFRRFLNADMVPARQATPPDPVLRRNAGLLPEDRRGEWVKLSDAEVADASAAWERSEWATGAKLRDVLEEHLTKDVVENDPSVPPEKFARAILRCKSRFVVLVDRNQQFDSLADRLTVAEKVAVAYVESATD